MIEHCSYKYSDINPKIITLDTYLSSFSKLYEYIDNKYITPITNYDKSLYYYVGNLTKEELVYFIDNVNLNFNNVLKNIVEIN